MRKSLFVWRNFKPKLNHSELEYRLRNREIEIHDDGLYALVNKLVSMAVPTHQDESERRWEYFLIPVKRNGKPIVLPFTVVEYKKQYYFYFPHWGGFSVGPGPENKESMGRQILREALRFAPVFRAADHETLIRQIPYDFRSGKIKGKYVLERLVPEKEKEKLAAAYKAHCAKKMRMASTSLNEYLSVSAICYRAAYGAKARRLSPIAMYRKWADGRDGGMLSLKDKDSRREFRSWQLNGKWAGAHPFEIVFSWIRHGIHLYPPSGDHPYFLITITNYGYVRAYIKMVQALIQNKIPFQADNYEYILDYLAGETYFTVNEHSEHSFFYITSRESKRRYFPHIEWDVIRFVRFK